ncbi:hypothetical protein QTH87_19435 [Variovorax sp. J22P168]|uniref:hypothetical protein n=1 Tax=Variovorax jilinensis TaxID=3053513 RepID=UPI002574C8DD|nr:hypothetical protein [Variovorax sp. J22P168]MDM0014624.1 hypothetical protein [Variovorax sp. J22P168]
MHPAVISRPTLGFTLEGLSDREETLFKAIVRLLDHRTLQRWVYRPASPDLRVVADDVPRPMPAGEGGAQPLVLTLSTQPGSRPHCLALPLRADGLEAELNILGEQRIGARNAALPHQATEAQPAPMKLLRWPAPELLGTPERLKLAALMVKRPFTTDWLQQRSDAAPGTCALFIAELKEAGLLAEAEDGRAVSAAAPANQDAAGRLPPARSGLLARIRHRLDLLVRPSST